MALYKVIRDSIWARRGDWLEDIEEGFVQKVDMVPEDGRLVPYTNYGLLIPFGEVEDTAVRIMKHGVDKKW